MSTWLSLLTQSAEQKTYEITNLLPETEYTVSIDGVYDSPVEVWLTTLVMVDDEIIETEVNQNNAVYVGDLENNKLTFTTQESHTALVIRALGDLDLTTIQLEKGTLTTDWTLAPEEQEQRLSSLITQTADEIRLEVSEVKGDVSSNTAQLSVQAGQISSKVSANGVVSAINQTPETIKIDANKINLTGYVTVSSLSGQGTTSIDGSNIKTGTISANRLELTDYVTVSSLSGQGTTSIDGSNIKTGTISANRINFNGATGSDVDLTGKITATSGEIAGLEVINRLLQYKPNATNNRDRTYFSGNPADTYVFASYDSSGTRRFSIDRTGGLYGNSVSLTSGYHNSGSFSSGAFGGTGNFPSGTLGGSTYSGGTGSVNFQTVGASYLSTGTRLGITDSTTGNRLDMLVRNGSWVWQNSDIRLKEDVKDVHDELNNLIYSLPIISYRYKGTDKNENRRVGINANFVDKMLPKEFTQYFISQDDINGYYEVQYEMLVPPLVKVVQSQNTRLIELEYEIAQLKKEMVK